MELKYKALLSPIKIGDMVLKNRSFDPGVYFSWGTNEAFKASVNHVSNFTSVAASGKSKIDASIASFIEALGE